MKSVCKIFGIIMGVIMMVSLFGCEKSTNNNEPLADISSLEITEEELLEKAVDDNIVFDYYEAVVASVGGNDSKEYVLYSCDYNGYLIMVRYTKEDGEPEYSYACLVPATTYDDCMKVVKKYKMTKWKHEIGLAGGIYVVRFSEGEENYRITSESMPENGMEAFDKIRSIVVSAFSEGVKK